MKFLFVCTGNICRSFFAEMLARRLAEQTGLSVETRSCGIAAEYHYSVPLEIWRCLEERGITRAPHTAQLVSRPLLQWADEVLVMTQTHKAVVDDSFPEYRRKVFILRERVGLLGEVIDPFGQSWAAYDRCAKSIEEALRLLLSPAPR